MVTCLKISGAASYDEVKTKLVSSGFCNDYVATYLIASILKNYASNHYNGVIRFTKHSTDVTNVFAYTITLNNTNDIPLSLTSFNLLISDGASRFDDYTLQGVTTSKTASYGNVYCVPAFDFNYGFIDGMLITLTNIAVGYQYTVNNKNYLCTWFGASSYRRILVEWTEPETAV